MSPITVRYYRLVSTEPTLCSLDEWAQYHGAEAQRILWRDEHGGGSVQTEFTGLHVGKRPPALFESRVRYQAHAHDPVVEIHHERYATWAQAERGHARLVDLVQRGIELRALVQCAAALSG